MKQCCETMRKNYARIWRIFNSFLIRLDFRPKDWESRASLFIAHLVNEGLQSSTIKSYISAIKKTLVIDGYDWEDNKVLLGTLTRACRIINDVMKTRLPIHCSLLEMILFEFQRVYSTQVYLQLLYKAVFLLGYYGLMRVGELTVNEGNHTVKAANVHIATNKEKLLVVLYTSKTHSVAVKPQKIKIVSNRNERTGKYVQRNFCPFSVLRNYIQMRGDYQSAQDPLFVFRDNSAVHADHIRALLKKTIATLGLDPRLYDVHSLRIGRTTDLVKFDYPIEEVKRMGKWKSNAVYRYIKP